MQVVVVTVQVLYWIDPESPKATTWNDGFVAAARGLADHGVDVVWTNCHAMTGAEFVRAIDAVDPDFAIVKSNWRWHLDELVQANHRRIRAPLGLMISGAVRPPRPSKQRRYTTLWYQTEWYARTYLGKHPRELHAYGANTDLLSRSTSPTAKDIDWLYVGAVSEHKRLHLLADKAGHRVVISELRSGDPEILQLLADRGVELHDYVPMTELPSWYWRANRVFVPATTAGGGERPLMEALACGTEVEVLPDNPKLVEVAAKGAEWTTDYYSSQLWAGIRSSL